MKDIKIDEAMSYARKKLDEAELKLVEKIRKGDENDVLRWRVKIEVYQNIIRDIINTYPQNSQEELMHRIEMLEKDRDMYKTLYIKTTELVGDVMKDNKKLSNKLCNAYR